MINNYKRHHHTKQQLNHALPAKNTITTMLKTRHCHKRPQLLQDIKHIIMTTSPNNYVRYDDPEKDLINLSCVMSLVEIAENLFIIATQD